MDDLFHGKGYAGSPITGEEAAKFRHMYSTVSQDWAQIRKIITLINAVSVLYEVIKIGGPVIFTLAVAGYYLKAQGII